jgi:mannose-6-phosphate isomerase-like protein (cupin superfamily)
LSEVVTSNRERVERLQEALSKLPQYQPVTHHYFADGMYCREVFREAGTLVVGAVHKREHFYIVVSGTVSITDGLSEAFEVTGPKVLVSQPGTKRAVYAHTDAVCITVHKTDKTDLDEVEADLVEEDPKSMYLTGNTLPLIGAE